MNIGKLVLLTATFMLAMALTFSCSSGDDDNGGGNAKNDCIKSELQIKANTLDNVATACDAKRSEVLSQLLDNVGNCNKNDLSFDKTIGNIMSECGASEFPVVGGSSSSGGGRSSSGGDNNNDPFAGIPEWEDMKEYYKYYDPDDREQRCKNGAVEERCEVDGNEVWYNPLTHVCSCWDLSVPGKENSGCGFGTIERCGNQLYSPYNGRCLNGIREIKCGDIWYNTETHYCNNAPQDLDRGTEIIYTIEAYERCGSKYYYPGDNYRCQNGVVENRCEVDGNEVWYNPLTHYCNWNTSTIEAYERCGSEYIDSQFQRCNNGVIESICGDFGDSYDWYNRITQSCNWDTGIVKAKLRCGS